MIKIAVMVLVAGLASGAAQGAGGTVPGAAPGRVVVPVVPDTLGGDAGVRDKREIKEELARIGRNEVPGKHRWERQKSAKVAMLSSMVLPGLGQLYNGRRLKTMFAVGTFTYYLGTAWFEQKKSQENLAARDGLASNTIDWKNQDILYQFHKENAVTYLWWSGAVWLITVLDAFIDAHLYDVRAVTPAVVRGAGGTKYVALSLGF